MGECFFWYRPTRVVPDQGPLNGRYCCCCCWLFYYSASTAIGSSLSVPALASDPSADICRHFIHPDGALLLLLVRSVVRTLLGRAAEKADDKRIAPDEIISPFQPGRDKRL